MAGAWIREGDTGPSLRVNLVDDSTGDNVDITGNESVTLHLRNWETLEVLVGGEEATVLDATEGLVEYVWESFPTAENGYEGFFRVTFASGEILSYPNDGWMTVAVLADIEGGS